jgi:hypothetical protein
VTSVCNDIELRELSTSPSGATSHVLFATSSYSDIPASRAFDNSGSVPLDFPYDRLLQLLLPEQHQQPLAARLLGPSGAPSSRRTGPKWLVALFAARKLHDRSLQSHTAQRISSSLQPRLPPGTQPGFDDLSHWLRPLDKTAGTKWYRAYLETVSRRPWKEAIVSSTEQRSSRLGFFSCEGFPQGCMVLGCSYWQS